MAVSTVRAPALRGITTCVPSRRLNNVTDTAAFAAEDVRKIVAMAGVAERRVVDEATCSSDLCFAAATDLLDALEWSRPSVDAVIMVTQTPDYIMPSSSCLLQERLGLSQGLRRVRPRTRVLGICLWAVAGVDDARQRRPSPDPAPPWGNPDPLRDRCRPGGGATVRRRGLGDSARGGTGRCNGPLEFRTSLGWCRCERSDDQGWWLPASVIFRSPRPLCDHGRRQGVQLHDQGDSAADRRGAAGFRSTRDEDVDYFIFHQSNRFIINHLVHKCGLEASKVPITLGEYGNSGGPSVPLTMTRAIPAEPRQGPLTVMLLGYGVGLSWAGCLIDLAPSALLRHVEWPLGQATLQLP